MKKIIYNITPFTTTDYKDHLSCIVWFISCNMRCLYCYNHDIINAKAGEYSVEDLLEFLKKRVGLLDSVVLSGGEATCHDLIPICKEIKKLNYKIKLDTNGSNPKLIEDLINNKLIDFVSLDFKANEENFYKITKSNHYKKFLITLNLLKKSNLEYEVRTTLHNDLLKEEDINEMQTVLVETGYNKEYCIQRFLEVDNLTKLEDSRRIFDKSKLNDNLTITWRN